MWFEVAGGRWSTFCAEGCGGGFGKAFQSDWAQDGDVWKSNSSTQAGVRFRTAS